MGAAALGAAACWLHAAVNPANTNAAAKPSLTYL